MDAIELGVSTIDVGVPTVCVKDEERVEACDCFLIASDSASAGDGSESVDNPDEGISWASRAESLLAEATIGKISPVKVLVRRTVFTPSDVIVMTLLAGGNSANGDPSSSPMSSHV